MSDEARPLFGFPLGPWHRWFAWHPVKTYDGRLIWLQRGERRGCQSHHYLDGPTLNWFQYRVPA